MSEQVMTAEELAEARELESNEWHCYSCGDAEAVEYFAENKRGELELWLSCESCKEPARREVIEAALLAAMQQNHRLLATVDALTARAEHAEGYLAAAERLTEERERERDEALEYAKRCEAGRASAMALAETRGRALEPFARCFSDRMERQLGGFTLVIESQQDGYRSPDTFQAKVITGTDFKAASEALSLPAPEALRQQQEREAGLVELLTQALPETMGGTPDLYAPSGGWEYWEGRARKAIEAAKKGGLDA